MQQKHYAALLAWLRGRPGCAAAVRWANRLLPAVVYTAYCGLLGFLALTGDARLGRAAAVPAAVFVLGSLLRRRLAAPRPYEVYDIQPLVARDRGGDSFPSRHLFSAGAIAMAFWYIRFIENYSAPSFSYEKVNDYAHVIVRYCVLSRLLNKNFSAAAPE